MLILYANTMSLNLRRSVYPDRLRDGFSLYPQISYELKALRLSLGIQ